jgi:hypothetical protein
MNLLSTVDDALPTINLDKWNLLRWFKKNKGKAKQPVFRPLLTNEHKQARLTFIDEMQELLQQGTIIGYLDEAWKYLWSLRMKMKHLLRVEFEEEGADRIQVRRVKPEHNFDGKITIKRISRSRQLERDTYRVNKFHYDNHINQLEKLV